MYLLDKLYVMLYAFLKKDNQIKMVILALQCFLLFFIIYFIRKKLGMENILFGKKYEAIRMILIFSSTTIFGLFNHFYFSPKKINKLLKK